jgi:PAS domain S-box-containing protein
VTEERQAARAIREQERQLRESEGRLRLFIEHAPAAIAMFDRDMRYLAASRRWLTDSRLEDGKIIGKSHYEVFPEIPERWKEAHQRGLAGEVQRAEEDHFHLASGETIWLRWEIRPWFKEGSQVGGIVIFTEDITEGMRLRDQLRHRAEELMEVSRRKDDFLAMLGHELRNPLGPIRNGLHILKQPGASEVGVEKIRDIMERQVLHLSRLVDDLLDVSRFTRGKIVLRKEILDLGSVVRAAVEATRPLLEQSRHELSLHVPGEPIHVDADPTRLEQIITNLLINAIKFTDPGGKIWLSVDQEADHAEVRVRDNGIGISAEMLPQLFDIFEQAGNRPDRPRGGLGIGLMLARRLAELHGGTVQASSEGLGKGSEFVLRIPKDGSRQKIKPPGRQGESGQPATRRRRILVVDDNVDAGMSLAMLLRTLGHDVRVANDGPGALQAAESDPPEVALVDIGLPGMSGYDVARQLRQRPGLEQVQLVAITGYGQLQDRHLSQQAGFDHHLVKPGDPEVLFKLLK